MKQIVLFDFPREETRHPIVHDLIKTYDLGINILRASIDYNARGFLLAEIDGQEATIDAALQYASTCHVVVNKIESAILIDKETCVDCGACTAVCAVGALKIDENYELVFDKELCLDCKLCVTACPARAIRAVL